jgi:hypothetical protein
MAALRQETAIHSLSRAYLESFTSQELLGVAAQLSVDLPEGLSNRTLIIGEILDAFEENLRSEESGIGKEADQKTAAVRLTPSLRGNPFLTVKIPERYNITYIKVLVRDPLWFFAFWEIKESMMEKLVKMEDFDGFCLRVNVINVLDKGKGGSSYTVLVGNGDKAWYLDFPVEGDEFFVEICARVGGREEALARSLAFRQPKILSSHEISENPLAVLSGIRVLPILREKNRSHPRSNTQ